MSWREVCSFVITNNNVSANNMNNAVVGAKYTGAVRSIKWPASTTAKGKVTKYDIGYSLSRYPNDSGSRPCKCQRTSTVPDRSQCRTGRYWHWIYLITITKPEPEAETSPHRPWQDQDRFHHATAAKHTLTDSRKRAVITSNMYLLIEDHIHRAETIVQKYFIWQWFKLDAKNDFAQSSQNHLSWALNSECRWK